jgi:hypothetical protein
MSFADHEHGWAFVRSAGGGATSTYVTTDGGRNWAIDTPVRHAPLWDAATGGWAALDFSPQEGLTRTTDGGRTWNRVNLYLADTVQPIAANGETVVAFTTATDGVLVRPSFAVTTDGGDSWTERRGPRDVVHDVTASAAATALDADRWWLAAGSRLFATLDGGREWTQIAEFAGISQVTDVHFPTPEIGFVSAIGAGDAANSSVVLRTADGGDTWTTVANHAPGLTRASQVVDFPGGIIGCPTHALAAPPPGDPPPGLIDAAMQNIETTRGWTPAGTVAYRVGTTAGSFSEVFDFHVPSCGPGTVDVSWVVELRGAPGTGSGGSTPNAEIVLAYSPDGWHVYGRYH